MKITTLFLFLMSTQLFSAEADNFTAYQLDLVDQTEALNALVNKNVAEAVQVWIQPLESALQV